MNRPAQVEVLLDAVKQLPPEALAHFTASLEEWRESGEPAPEAFLIQQARAALPAAQQKRLQKLAGKSEQGELAEDELSEYRGLVERAERVNVARMSALAELARRRNQPVQRVMQEIGR